MGPSTFRWLVLFHLVGAATVAALSLASVCESFDLLVAVVLEMAVADFVIGYSFWFVAVLLGLAWLSWDCLWFAAGLYCQ